MKNKIKTILVFWILSFFMIIVFGVAEAGKIDSELDFLVGDWYDDTGNLYASIHDGYFNSCPMQFITIAGGPSNFAMTIQIKEAIGYRHVELIFSDLKEGEASYSPLRKPYVSIDSVKVHKKNFVIPKEIYQYLNGTWYDESGKLVAVIQNELFNENPMFFISFYGTIERYLGVIQVNNGYHHDYYYIDGNNNNFRLVNMSDRIHYKRLRTL